VPTCCSNIASYSACVLPGTATFKDAITAFAAAFLFEALLALLKACILFVTAALGVSVTAPMFAGGCAGAVELCGGFGKGRLPPSADRKA